MKREKDIYSKIMNRGNLYSAHIKASKGKAHYTEVRNTNLSLENKLSELKELLESESYSLKKEDYSFELINDKGKERELYKLPYYPHRIIQWAIINVTMPIFMKNFTDCTYASLKKRGIHLAVKKLRYNLGEDKQGTKYCLKLDIKKFYPSINNQILMNKIERKFKDIRFLNLMRTIIFSMGDKGIPIGSLLSQYLANFYLSSFDHYCKEILKLKYYHRYMDDIVILHSDKRFLHGLKIKFDKVLDKYYDLTIKSNWQIFPVDARGIDFVGYRFFHNRLILRRRIYIKSRYVFSRPYKHKAFYSYYGWCKHTNMIPFMEKYKII